MGVVDRMKEHPLVRRARSAGTWVMHSRAGRAGARYWMGRGNLLAGGIAYAAMFSVFAALAIGYTAFMSVLGSNEELRSTVLSSVDQALPGVLDDGSGSGVLRPDQLVLDPDLTFASVVAAGVLVWSALRVMTALRRSVRMMFGLVAPPENAVVNKTRDVAGFLGLALGVLLSSVLSLGAGAFAEAALSFVGVDGPVAGQLLRLLGFAVAGLVDGTIFVLILRLTAGARPPRRDLLLGAVVWAVVSALLRLVGAGAIASVDNPLLASFTALVTLLLWVNILARAVLYVAAFTANPPFPARASSPEDVRYRSRPNYVTLSAPGTLAWPHHPVTGAIVPAGEIYAVGVEPAARRAEEDDARA